MLTSISRRSVPKGMESQSRCFVCGQANPNGLRIQFHLAEDESVEARWIPKETWEGFPGIIHGGIVATVLDEAMSKAVAALGCKALTAELKVRYRKPASCGQEYAVRGWVIARQKRRIRAEAIVAGGDGGECAHGWGTFLIPPDGVPSPEKEPNP